MEKKPELEETKSYAGSVEPNTSIDGPEDEIYPPFSLDAYPESELHNIKKFKQQM